MLKKILYTTLAICFTACSTNRQASSPATMDKAAPLANVPVSTVVDDSAKNANGFWGGVFEELCRKSNKENVCLSPLSAQFALAMLANGAEGETKDEIYRTLVSNTDVNGYYKMLLAKNSKSEGFEINTANSIWINSNLSVKEPFITKNKEYYDATIEVTKFNKGTLQRINGWCKKKTNGKIPTILSDIRPSDMVYLINALYFNADWDNPFKKENTRKEDFTTEKGKVVEVNMMKQRENMLYQSNEMFDIAVKRYKSNYSMLLALPKEGIRCDIAADTLMQNIDKYLSEMDMSNVELSLPKFTTEFGSSLKEVIEQQGITKAFGAGAELKGISDAPLCVDNIIQKTYINVDEEGTEAAAVTAIIAKLTSMRPQNNVTMKLDRPFVYVIIDNENNEVLFVGKVGNPIEK